MSEFHVVPYESRFLDGITALWKERYAADGLQPRRVLFEWLTQQNPFLDGRAPYYLLLDQERVIGMHGHMPLRFSIDGRMERGYLAHDDLLSADYRGKGLGKVMLEHVARMAPAFAGALWFNEPNHKMYTKSGWTDVSDFLAQVKVYDPAVFLRRRISNEALLSMASSLGRVALAVQNMLRAHVSTDGMRVELVSRFTPDFDALYALVAPHLGISVQRTHEYLNWKYCDKPFSAYTRYAAVDRAGTLQGYLITKMVAGPKENEGVILDLLTAPSGTAALAALVARCLDDFEAARVSRVMAMCSLGPSRALLSRLGFLHARNADYFMVSNHTELMQRRSCTRVADWYLTYADADGDAWSVDTAPHRSV